MLVLLEKMVIDDGRGEVGWIHHHRAPVTDLGSTLPLGASQSASNVSEPGPLIRTVSSAVSWPSLRSRMRLTAKISAVAAIPTARNRFPPSAIHRY